MTTAKREWKVERLPRGTCDNCQAQFTDNDGALLVIREVSAVLCNDCCTMLALMMSRIR